MKIMSLVLSACLMSSMALADTSGGSAQAILAAKNAQLEKANQALETRVKALETEGARWAAAELAAAAAQTSANTAQATANSAQTTASSPGSSYTQVGFPNMRGFHDACVPQASSGPGCMAAVHRYCNSIGFTAGLIQEVGGDAYGVACFR